MFKLILLVGLILLTGCSSPSHTTDPTPFIVSDKRIIVVGCEKLHKEVADWNAAHPMQTPKVADC